MKLKIISDGTNKGTKLIDENGEEIDGVVGIKWECRIRKQEPKIIIDFVNIPMESEIKGDHIFCKRPRFSYWLNCLRGWRLNGW